MLFFDLLLTPLQHVTPPPEAPRLRIPLRRVALPDVADGGETEFGLTEVSVDITLQEVPGFGWVFVDMSRCFLCFEVQVLFMCFTFSQPAV